MPSIKISHNIINLQRCRRTKTERKPLPRNPSIHPYIRQSPHLALPRIRSIACPFVTQKYTTNVPKLPTLLLHEAATRFYRPSVVPFLAISRPNYRGDKGGRRKVFRAKGTEEEARCVHACMNRVLTDFIIW